MRCEVVQTELSARMDGARDARLDREIGEHTATCERCRRFESRSRQVRAATRLEHAAPVPDLVPVIMQTIEAEPLRARRAPTRALTAVAGIAAVAITALVLSISSRPTDVDVPVLAELRARTLLAWTPVEVPTDLADAIAQTEGVTATTQVRSAVVWLDAWTDSEGRDHRAPDGLRIPMEVAAIDTRSFGRFVLDEDRAALAEVDRGAVVLGDGGAGVRDIDGEGSLTFGRTTLQVRGIVDDELIGRHEAVVSTRTGRELAIGRVRYLLVELADDASSDDVSGRIRALATRDHPIRVRTLGETPQFRHGDAVLPQVRIKERFGEFAAAPAPNGNLRVHRAWAEENIVKQDVPVLGPVRCHRRIFPALRGAMAEISSAGLAPLIDRGDYGGCYFPRFLSQDEEAGISHHSWGVAFDINVEQNPFGKQPELDARIVEIMKRWGFAWGGRWLIPDGMHFEYLRQPAEASP